MPNTIQIGWRLAGLVLLGTTLGGCCSDPDVWSFSVSCAVAPGIVDNTGSSDARLGLALLAVPFAVDLAFLPVTAVHDLWPAGDDLTIDETEPAP